MAIFYPSREEIKNDMMEKHTAGELALLNELQRLPNDFLVYYQPHINYAHPDIIILHKTGGALIIEVKDWDLSLYSFHQGDEDDDYGYLKVLDEPGRITTPFYQVQKYKDEFFRTLCPELTTESMRLGVRGRNVYGVIRTGVYFHNASSNAAVKLFIESGQLAQKDGIKKYKAYTSYWCREDLSSIASNISFLMQPHPYFTSTLFKSMKAFLVPSDAWLEQTVPFDLSKLDQQQKTLAQCVPGTWTRIKGTAGSGKTLVVAQKAINCYQQKKTPVLILTYNITLRNYIRDRIAQNTRDMSQRERSFAFEILHYDAFLPQALRKMELRAPHPGMFKDLEGKIRWEDYHQAIADILDIEKRRLIEYGCRYDTVLIDEAQDYERGWFELIEKYFLSENAEFLVVADEKQNLYERQLEDKLPIVPGFRGPWRKLSKSYRLSETTFALASDFQKTYMNGKYDLDLGEITCTSEEKGMVRYFRMPPDDDRFGKIWWIVNEFRKSGKCTSPNDICILLNDINSIRAMEYEIRKRNAGITLTTMCETQEEYNELLNQKRHGIIDDLDYELDRIRNMRKYRFNMNSGTMKICTVHSFKGWEISTIVLVIDDSDSINDELVYTAITRAKQNIIIINFGNEKYHSFFAEHDHHAPEAPPESAVKPAEKVWFSNDPSLYVRSETRTGYVYIKGQGIARIDKIDGDIFSLIFANGKKSDLNYKHFFSLGKMCFAKLKTEKAKPATKSSVQSEEKAESKPSAAEAKKIKDKPAEKAETVKVAAATAQKMPDAEQSVSVESDEKKPEKKRIDLKSNVVPVMLEPMERKKMLTYLSVHRPELIEESPDPDAAVQYVLEHVFPQRLQTPCIVSNYSYYSEASGTTRYEFTVTSVNSNYLRKRLESEDLQLKVHGLLNPNNVLRIKDIEIVSQSECAENEMQYDLKFYYPQDNPKHKEYTALTVIAEGLPSYTRAKEDELSLWTEYIDWKQRLAEIKVFGIKYIDYRIDDSSNSAVRLHFLAVMPDEISCVRLLKLARKERDQISVFSSDISKDRWEFVYNQEAKSNISVDLRLVRISQIDLQSWPRDINHDSSALDKCLNEIEAKADLFTAPCYAEAVFDVPEEYEELFEEREFTPDQMYDYVVAKLARFIKPDGYIATSRVGDFSLNKRLKDALTNLRTGHSVSGNLGNWLFDITQAHAAPAKTNLESIEWSPWGKKHLNDSQKEVVRKMLDAPEVFLCQGPPGTGKTTVIAEAVYQLALRKKRVLIASQTNLAVNNALSKLLGYPGIRAIRLGGQGKIDSSVENITEENILRTFYGNVRSHLQERYFSRWNAVDEESREQREDAEKLKLLTGRIKRAQGQGQQYKQELLKIREQIIRYNEKNDMDDAESDLYLMDVALATATGENIPAVIQINADNVDLILTGVTGYLSELQESGYKLDEDSIDLTVTSLSELPKRKKLSLVRNIIRFTAFLHATFEIPQDSVSDEEAELQELMQKQQALMLSPMSDYESFVELKKLNEQINNLKKKGGQVTASMCPETLIPCFPEKYVDRLKAGGLTSGLLQSIREETESAVENCFRYVIKCLLAVQKRYNETEAADRTAADEIANKAVEIIDLELKNAESAAEAGRAVIALAQKYNCPVAELRDTFTSIKKDLQRKDSKLHAEREEYEEFFNDLVGHIDRLGDESQYKLENEIYQTPFINACNVVGVSCTERPKTLAGKGFDKFDVVIIDEVSKATPPEMLIPLLLAERAILVGDHRQLPPLFNERYSSYQELKQAVDADAEDNRVLTDENYERFESLVTNSLFKRHYEQAAKENKGALLVQYRMHRDIMNVVNHFYNGQLMSGWTLEEEKTEKRHYLNALNSSGSVTLITPEHHAYWIDSTVLHGTPVYEKQEGSSKTNQLEAALAMRLVQQIDDCYADQGFERIEVGVISFYGRQVKKMRDMLSKLRLKCVKCDINTVDRFQGKEKPIVIVSLVRSVEPGKPYDADYVKAFQRMNVAFSRAQNLLIMLGSEEMYTKQDIVIENMENGEKLPPRKVYKDIVQKLAMEGCRFTADEFLGPEADKIVFEKA